MTRFFFARDGDVNSVLSQGRLVLWGFHRQFCKSASVISPPPPYTAPLDPVSAADGSQVLTLTQIGINVPFDMKMLRAAWSRSCATCQSPSL